MISKGSAVLNQRFQLVAEVGMDERKRVSLAKALEVLKGVLGEGEGLRFAVYANDAGQVLLSPKISVPLHELWLYRNPEAFAAVNKGLTQAGKRDKLKELGSFEQYADDELD